jgi:hypothetical protein
MEHDPLPSPQDKRRPSQEQEACDARTLRSAQQPTPAAAVDAGPEVGGGPHRAASRPRCPPEFLHQ